MKIFNCSDCGQKYYVLPKDTPETKLKCDNCGKDFQIKDTIIKDEFEEDTTAEGKNNS